MRCTVLGLTSNLAAVLRTLMPTARAALIRSASFSAIGGRPNASTGARVVAPSLGQGIDPHQMMMNTKGLATAELVDYTFVFH
jgi:hypothetical protein